MCDLEGGSEAMGYTHRVKAGPSTTLPVDADGLAPVMPGGCSWASGAPVPADLLLPLFCGLGQVCVWLGGKGCQLFLVVDHITDVGGGEREAVRSLSLWIQLFFPRSSPADMQPFQAYHKTRATSS